MKTSRLKTKLKLLLPAALLCVWAGSSSAQPVGQWDFLSGDLSATVGGVALTYADGPGGTTASGTHFNSTTGFGISLINGTNANVMQFPASSSGGGFNMPTPASPNGGSPDLVNAYTIIMDVLFQTNDVVRPLVQTDGGVITPDADLVVDTSGGIGAPPGPFTGQVLPNTWYRLAFAIDATNISKYINGVQVGIQPSGGLDSRFALTPGGFAQLFQNSTLNGAAPGFVSSIQIWDSTLNPGQIDALGAASATKISTNVPSVPSFIVSRTPLVNTTNNVPNPVISAVVDPGGTTVDANSFSITLDGATVPSTSSFDGAQYTITTTTTSILPAFSTHEAALIYSDSALGLQTNAWTFAIARYQNVTLPSPIYFENFDEVTNGGIPAGWVATNWTDSLEPGVYDITDTQSDSYLNWVAIDIDTYATTYPDTDDYISPGFPEISGNRRQMIPPIVENGILLSNLTTGSLIVAESDQRGQSQVQVIFTQPYDFTGHSNVYVSFHNLDEQNQDNICSVEYSIGNSTNWQPLLYMLDDGTTDSDGSDVITNFSTKMIDVFATFNTARNDQAHGLSYGTYIGAPITTNLIPFIRPCRNDDPVQQKRIELFRLPLADNQTGVRLRFMQAGTGSWFFDVDDLGFYSVPQPIILQQPTPVLADYNGPATFTVVAGGDNLVYQWKFNNTNISGATASSYVIANTTTNDVGLYSVVVSNSVATATSDQEALTLVFTPVILTAPQDVTISVGEPSSFSILARGGQPLSYQWLLNSNAIAGATNTTYSIANTQTNKAGAYQVLVSNAFSTVLSPVGTLTVVSGPISNQLVVHLTFDNTYADATGRGNDGTPVNTPVFTNGIIGGAVHVNNNGVPAGNPSTNNYVTLGYPADLMFGSDADGNASDFSVSFWTKIFEQNDDQSFIGNKDWNSGSNPGWIIDTEGDGMKWNYRDSDEHAVVGEGSIRRDSPHFAPQMEDGGWHHVVVTFGRHSVAKAYVDGVLLNTTALGTDSPTNILGSVDTADLGFSVNICQDGTGNYTDGGSASHVNMLMDDVGIWRRVLTDQETLGIFNAGLNGIAMDKATTTSTGKAPVIQVPPIADSTTNGATVSFYAGVLGTPPLSYQWFFGASPVLGATNATLTVTNLTPSLAGNYTIIVTNTYGAATNVVGLTDLNAPNAPTFSGVVYNGTTITLKWTGGNPPFNIQKKTNLTDPSWGASVGTTSSNSITLPVSGTTGFYRISGN